MNIKILVATHKKYDMPTERIYLPIHVGKAGKESLGYQGDDIGDNISWKNTSYCELTGVYWGWKNLQCDYIGLCHYRRYFLKKYSWGRKLFKRILRQRFDILDEGDFSKILKEHDIILPKRADTAPYTVYEHYAKNHNIRDLDVIRNIIREHFPEYYEVFDEVILGRKSLYAFNMLVAKKSLYDEYCEWLFKILGLAEKKIDISSYDNYQRRVFGFLSERLLNVWVEKQKLSIYEADVGDIGRYCGN